MALLTSAGIIVKIVLLILIFFSVVSWAIILFKLFQIHRANSESERFMDFFWKSKRFDAIASQADRFLNSPLTVLFNEGYGELKKVVEGGEGRADSSILSTDLGGIENVSRALRRATNSEITRLEKYTTFLATTGSTSPFIGLFGTVWGIMSAFEGIGKTGSASLAVVAPGIAEALIATAIGIAVAVPAVLAYNFLMRQSRRRQQALEIFAEDFLHLVSAETANR